MISRSRFICWLFGHAWALFTKYGEDESEYFYCRRCGKVEDYYE